MNLLYTVWTHCGDTHRPGDSLLYPGDRPILLIQQNAYADHDDSITAISWAPGLGLILLLSCFLSPCVAIGAICSIERANDWPPIATYADLETFLIPMEISLIKKDLAHFQNCSDPRAAKLVDDAAFRLALLLKRYQEQSGRPMSEVKRMFGVPEP